MTAPLLHIRHPVRAWSTMDRLPLPLHSFFKPIRGIPLKTSQKYLKFQHQPMCVN
jgi:hypothetical protein